MGDEPLPSSGVASVASNGEGPTGDCLLGTSFAGTTFVAATERLENGVPVVSVEGELNLATAWTLEDALIGLYDATAATVIVDLARCSFIDLRGLRVLLAARERLERSGGRLALVAGNPDLLRIFKITRVHDLFEIHRSLSAAAEGTRRG